MASRAGGRVLLRIEDHDRTRSRPEYDAALLEDLEWLGFQPDEGPVRQSEDDGPYRAALERLRGAGLVYGCDCSRTTLERWRQQHGRPWDGPGCPGECRGRELADDEELILRVALGAGDEAWDDRCLGPRVGEPSAAGDLALRDRHGNWTYGFAVVVDDLRQGITLVVRGQDLAEATPTQIRLGRLLGRPGPPVFAHHALIRKPGGAKLSKSNGDTGVRELRAAGRSPADVIGAAAAAAGLISVVTPLEAAAVAELFRD